MPRVLGLLILALAGCKSIPHVEVVEVPGPTRYVQVDEQLTRPCPIEAPVNATPMEAVRVAKARKDSLEACNRKLERIRAIEGTTP